MSTVNPKLWIETPLVESAALSRAAGCRILLKLENLQPSGSFKSRGIGSLLSSSLKSRSSSNGAPVHFYSSSGGNAGLACAHAARTLSLPSTIIVPLSTPASMIAKLKLAGAGEVIQHGASWREADGYLQEQVLPKDKGGVYVPPFDHEDIWRGNSTLVSELEGQIKEYSTCNSSGNEAANHGKPAAIICSVGGGGLFNGICSGLDAIPGWKDVPIFALETAGAESLAASLSAGSLTTLPGITSKATNLGATRVAERTYVNARDRKNVHSIVLSDAEAAMGCYRFADEERILVELSCGVSLAMCWDGRLAKYFEEKIGRNLEKSDRVVMVVCGGSNISLETILKYKVDYGLSDDGSLMKGKTVGEGITQLTGDVKGTAEKLGKDVGELSPEELKIMSFVEGMMKKA
ncbi:tryptophan synthase beta subunit-like PLP-dependent enzyme [Aulographum hederae CBS 113979]|uniref:L-serine ammonia-lyase n=1 Tax=Aulographum hederae CBS 113979 TaxID=1176131 RepID=A0A6G1H3H3_9PEZI|nr:tryptophan synthase beta subunit-like PLP-dependent enzyme [Aulographum hederae CBS 113979]